MNPAVASFVDSAIAAASEQFGVTSKLIGGGRGNAQESFARAVAMYVVLTQGRMRSTEAAPYFGREASALRHARKAVDDHLDVYPADKERVAAVARFALDRASVPGNRPSSLCAADLAFLNRIFDVLTNPKHASQASDLRMGQKCVTYSTGGALALHPFKGTP